MKINITSKQYKDFIINESKHPCANKNCYECEHCIFDEDLFLDNNNKKDMGVCTSCHICGDSIKNYIDEERFKFNACCGRFKVMYANDTRPRIIKANIGPMIPLTPPEWCPKNNGITQMSVSSESLIKESSKALPAPSQVSSQTENKSYKNMTYSEKRERLMSLPKHLKWEEIEEDGVYVIPKILSQSRKVVRVVMKNDNLIRCCEIDEYGKEGTSFSSIYPKDIETVFITKVLKY